VNSGAGDHLVIRARRHFRRPVQFEWPASLKAAEPCTNPLWLALAAVAV
jgi:hypothetical protein